MRSLGRRLQQLLGATEDSPLDPSPDSLEASIRSAAESGSSRGSVPPTMLAWMPPSPFNSYPQLLYESMHTEGIATVGISPYDMVEARRLAQSSGAVIAFHQHWTGWVLGGEADAEKADERLRRAFRLLDGIEGAPLVWTVHNAMPHECPFPDRERSLRTRLAEQAQLIHIMNPNTVELVAGDYQLPEDKVFHLPHPSYTGHYPALPSKVDAERRLGLAPAARRVSFVGQVRAYKRVDLLLEALTMAPDVRALIAGATGADEESQDQSARAAAHPQVDRIDRHLDDLDLMAALAAGDAVVLPYRRALNSGVLALTRSFGRPVIVADADHLRPLTDPMLTAVFTPDDPMSLAGAIAGPLPDAVSTADEDDVPLRFAQIIRSVFS